MAPPIAWRRDTVLKRKVFKVRQDRSKFLPVYADQVCQVHWTVKHFFCEVTKEFLCEACCDSKAHEEHGHNEIKSLAEHYRQQLLRQMRLLWRKKQENQREQQRESTVILCWRKYLALRREMIREEYHKVKHLLVSEEKCSLERIEMEGRYIYEKLVDNRNLRRKVEELLQVLYWKLEGKCRRPDEELLLKWESLMTSSQILQEQVPQPLNICLSSQPITGLVRRLSGCLEHLSWEEEKTTLNSPLLEGVRAPLRRADGPEDVQQWPKLKYFLTWASQCFTSGQHYWELDVGGCQNWVAGLCSNSWTKKNDMALDSEGIFLLICVKEDDQCRLFTSSPLQPQFVKWSQSTMGVFLDYDRGTVSFVDVVNSSLICSLLSCTFSAPLRPFLCSASP
ncbi:tripartite motif-containing protein 51-like [Erinaceus europaeus]|uniref:Tripartite motif-containing protein 51-like n=1 Tax=Erinaceus europaeus TaxID=9365 RepID=A0A1S3ANL0_ERIEU|nr:tripartite motif-containing protein 51-like [Erinaceus europaeus]